MMLTMGRKRRQLGTSMVRVIVQPGEARVRLIVIGELDLASAPALARLASIVDLTKTGHLDLDLGGVTFIDGTGLRALQSLVHGIRDAGGTAVIVETGPGLRRLEHALERSFESGDYARWPLADLAMATA